MNSKTKSNVKKTIWTNHQRNGQPQKTEHFGITLIESIGLFVLILMVHF